MSVGLLVDSLHLAADVLCIQTKITSHQQKPNLRTEFVYKIANQKVRIAACVLVIG